MAQFGQQPPKFSFNPQHHEPSFGERAKNSIMYVLSNPMLSTVLLVGLAILFAGTLYFSGGSEQQDPNVPVIQASNEPYKFPGDDNLTISESGIYDVIEETPRNEPAPIENLLADDVPIETLNEFSAKIEAAIKEAEAKDEVTDFVASLPQAATEGTAVKKTDSKPETVKQAQKSIPKSSEKKIENIVTEIAPAAGNAKRQVSAGNHYVQVGSIQDQSRAVTEWGRKAKQFGVLSGLNYRTQRADLGAKGVFYRIQAGPMAKADAQRICSDMKAQKPGSCLVTN